MSSTKLPLRLLLVEDREADALLVLRELRRGYDVIHTRVQTAADMQAALEQPWDVVVSDFSMPQFSGGEAFTMVRQKGMDVPFIMVSGTIGEEDAVEAMRVGVHDFVSKQKLARLLPAVERELGDAAVRAERKKMHEQLMISERMVSVGTLAAGVAHEINNPLAALLANLEYSLREVETLRDGLDPRLAHQDPWVNQRFREILDPMRDCREAAERIRHIVRDLRLFSRVDKEQYGQVHVDRVLDSSLRMAWNEIRHRARLVKEYGDVPAVLGSAPRLGQVFLNLIVNAAQAMPEGRSDTHELRVVTCMAAPNKVMVEIRDTGSGMTPEVLEHIFEPFFTTKPAGMGTGLGLAICKRLVLEMQGEISVESRVSVGTTFRVILPAAKETDISIVPFTRSAQSMHQQKRIMVVDDDPMMATAVRRMLHAHDVLAVNTGREAIDRVFRGERFDVILCDLMMPQTNGVDVHRELQAIDADQAQRMVFMTGGAFSPDTMDFLDRTHHPHLEKPFDAQGLLQVVNPML